MLCSMDAMWRVFGYQTYPAPYPTVIQIKVKLPAQLLLIQSEQKLCDLLVYLARPATVEFENMLFTEFFKTWKYGYEKNIPAKHKNKPMNQPHGDIHKITKFIKDVYIYKRNNPADNIVRMGICYVKHGEIWYLRRLLLNLPTYSLEALRVVNNVEYPTFQQAAIERGYVSDVTEALLCFNEVKITLTPPQLRSLFVTMTLQGYVTTYIYNDDNNKQLMYADYLDNDPYRNENNANNKLLQYISDRLTAESKSNTIYGLPEPESISTELEVIRARYNADQQRILYEAFIKEFTPTEDEQQPFLDRVFRAIINKESLIILLQGEGGSGKSTMAKIIIAFARSLNKIVLGCASTALAASIYDDFYTAHSLFKIPVIEQEEEMLDQENDFKCDLDRHFQRKQLLQATDVFIWDEISSQHVRDFTAVYHAMNKFDNKILILMGDKMQIAPVVKYGNKAQIISSSIYCSQYMQFFEKRYFTKNLRLIATNDQQQLQYKQTLLHIGKGTYFRNVDNNEFINNRCPIVIDQTVNNDETTTNLGVTKIGFPDISYESDPNSLIHWLHPNGFDLSTITTNCILAVTNDQVDIWNKKIQDMNINTVTKLISVDSFVEVDDPHDYLKNMITDHVMNTYTENGSPPHELDLKLGDICILLRNVDVTRGLTSNTRVKIISISPYRINVCTINTDRPILASLCRFKFELTLPFGKSLTMQRIQFPLRLAYALSYNKAQGQEFQKLGADITHPSFSHGHLYVALSRIRLSTNIKFFITDENLIDGIPYTDNVVYNEIINSFDNF